MPTVERYRQGVTGALLGRPRLRLRPANGSGGRQYHPKRGRLTLSAWSRKMATT